MKYVIVNDFGQGELYLMHVKLWDAAFVRELSRARTFDDWNAASHFLVKHGPVLGENPRLYSFTDREYFKKVLEGK